MYLELNNLKFGYNRQSLVDEPVIINIEAPQLCVLFGNNGCGKTTLIKNIARLIHPLSGKIFFNKKNIFEMDNHEFSKSFSFLFTRRPFLMNHTVYDIIALGRSPYLKWNARLSEKDIEIIYQYAQIMNIENILNKPAEEISDGQFQKTLIAKVLVQQSSVIVLDEPLSHLDFGTKKYILHKLKEISIKENKIIIISAHDIDLSKIFADNILLFHQKKWQLIKSDDLENNYLFKEFYSCNII